MVGADDDADCAAHVWLLDELHLTPGAVDNVEQCHRCGAVRYRVDAPGQDARRPRLA